MEDYNPNTSRNTITVRTIVNGVPTEKRTIEVEDRFILQKTKTGMVASRETSGKEHNERLVK